MSALRLSTSWQAAMLASAAVLACGDPDSDHDGDGLSRAQERAGWQVVVDRQGYGLASDLAEQYTVTSDPDVADTDGDGLSDREEREATTDPRSPDTDGDGLTDFEELRLYRTSPQTVDTDDDSREPRREGLAWVPGQATPNPALFDGSEVRQLRTSPTLVDTDGDGRSDYREQEAGVAALLARVPEIAIDVAPDPYVELDANWTDVLGSKTGTTLTHAAGTSTSQSSGRTDARTTTSAYEATRAHELSVSTEVSASLTDLGASVSTEYTASFSSTRSSSHGMEATSSQSVERVNDMREEQAELRESSRDRQIAYTGGRMRIKFDLANLGAMPVLLSNLQITAQHLDPARGAPALLGVAAAPEGGATAWSMGVGAVKQANQAELEFHSAAAAEAVARGDGFLFTVSNYTLTDAETGLDYIVQDSEVQERTALLVIDYGDGELHRFRIAPPFALDPETRKPRAFTMAEALGPAFLDLDYELRETADGVPMLAALQLPESHTLVESGRERAGYWMVIGEGAQFDLAPGEPAPAFESLALQAGRQLSLLFVRDRDGDGLIDRRERALGLHPQRRDTDGDGLGDGEELRGIVPSWYARVLALADAGDARALDYVAAFELPRRATSDPRLFDTDGDGWNDAREVAEGTDPAHIDTDRDGYPDPTDPQPNTPERGEDAALLQLDDVLLAGHLRGRLGSESTLLEFSAQQVLAGLDVTHHEGAVVRVKALMLDESARPEAYAPTRILGALENDAFCALTDRTQATERLLMPAGARLVALIGRTRSTPAGDELCAVGLRYAIQENGASELVDVMHGAPGGDFFIDACPDIEGLRFHVEEADMSVPVWSHGSTESVTRRLKKVIGIQVLRGRDRWHELRRLPRLLPLWWSCTA